MVENKKLGDVLTFQRGFDITKKDQRVGDVPIVSSSGVHSYHNNAKAKGPGIVIGRKGTLGTVHYIRGNYWPHDTTLWVKNFKGTSPEYLRYFLPSLKLEFFDVGASNPTLNRNHLHKLQVKISPPSDQRKIAAILIAYDDLIENNRQRIALLENMAEEIYREWFVRLRFPGHEHTPVHKGVPEGWERRSVSKLGRFVNGYPFKPSEHFDLGHPIIKIKELNSGVTEATPRHDRGLLKSRYHVNDGDVLFSWSGSLVVRMWDEGEALLNQHLFKVTPFVELEKPFVYLSLQQVIPAFAALTTGATMQHIRKGELDVVSVIAPPNGIMRSFCKLAQPLLDQRLLLAKASKELAKTRDLLLNRLISGKLRVDDLDIQCPPSMQNIA
nr:restriction endonuclease subunit S [uncultured Halomonas sp.]